MGTDRGRLLPDAATVPWLISGSGLALLLAYAVETAVFSGLDPDLLLSQQVFVGFLTFFPFAVGLVYGGYRLAESGVEPGRYWRVVTWCLGGSAVFVALNAALMVAFPPDTLWTSVGWLRGSAAWGAAGGLLVGLTEARAIQNAIEAERESVRASYLRNQHEAIDYLNGLLRHEVLNTAQVITGYSSVLLETTDLDSERRSQLAAIRRQGKDMATVVEDIRLLTEAMRDEAPLRPVDLSAMLRDELQDVRDGPQPVTIDADVPDDITVRADGFLPRVFGNLFDNAVEHNDGEEPHLAVTVETDDESATVRVADDGPGIPPEMRENLFERDELTHSEYGLGLVLVGRLIERYGGSVALADTGPDGSTFTVTLPLADGATGDAEATGPDERTNRAQHVASDTARSHERSETGRPPAARAAPDGAADG